MAATQVAEIPLNLKYHWENILNKYTGKECTHIKVTKTLDPNGIPIDESEVETTIYGAISPVREDAVRESAGTLLFGDLVAYFLSEEGVLVGTQTAASEARYDLIVHEGIRYTVENKRATAYDGGIAVVDKFTLRKVANEVA